MPQRIINSLFVPMVLIAFLVGAVAGNEHGERFGMKAGELEMYRVNFGNAQYNLYQFKNEKVASNAR